MNIREIEIKKIKFNQKKRIRKELGDLESLKESIAKYGLFYPLIVTPEFELLAGQRRMEAIKQLGWDKVDVLIVNMSSNRDKFEIEVEENLIRKQFTLEEVEELLKRRRMFEEKNIFKKIWNLILRFFRWLKNIFTRSSS